MGRCKSGLSRLNLFWWYHYIQNISFKTYDSIIIGGTPVIFRKNDDLNLTWSGRSHMTSVLWLQSFLYLKPIWCSNFIKIYLDTLRFSCSMKYFRRRFIVIISFHSKNFYTDRFIKSFWNVSNFSLAPLVSLFKSPIVSPFESFAWIILLRVLFDNLKIS